MIEPADVDCPECGNQQPDMGRGVQCEECGFGPLPSPSSSPSSAPAASSVWKPIPGFEGSYEINAAGDVRSWKKWRGDNRPLPRMMRIQHHKHGRRIQLGLYGGVHDVDKLVAELFENPSQGER